MNEEIIELTASIVSAHVEHNSVSVADLPALIKSVHAALTGLGQVVAEPAVERLPAMSIRSAVKPDSIGCLECGSRHKMLKRHLATSHGLSVADYRAKWKLPADSPMVAADYSEKRKGLALKIGLGRKKAAPAPVPAAKAVRKPRAPKAV